MTAYLTWLRTSPLRFGVVLLVALQGWLSFAQLTPGVDVWNESSAAVLGGVQLSGPFAAGIAAWIGGREYRDRSQNFRRLAARHPMVESLTELLATLTWVLLAYLVVTLILMVKTAIGATYGSPQVLWLTAGACGVALLTVLGFVLGRALPRIWVPPLVAIGTFLYVTWNLSYYGYRWFPLSPVTVQEVSLFRNLNSRLFTSQILWFCGAAVVVFACWALIANHRRLASSIVAMIGVLAAGAGALSVVQQDSKVFTGPSTFPYACTAQAPAVCVHPAFKKALPTLSQEFGVLDGKLHGTPAQFSRVEQRPRGVGSAPSPGSGRFSLDDMRKDSLKNAVSEYLDYSIGTGEKCVMTPTPDGKPPANLAFLSIVRSWLSDDTTISMAKIGEQADAQRWFDGLNESARTTWLQQHYQQVVDCTLNRGSFR